MTDPTLLFPTIFDIFVENGTGDILIADFPNPSIELGNELISDDVFFNGINASDANGGALPKLYAPVPYESGSSIAHLDEDTFPAGDPNSLMTPYIDFGEAIHDPGPITLGILKDLGWELQETTPDLADLTITKTDSPDPVAKGGTLTYTLTVSNAANGVDATGIEVRDILPTDFTVTDITVGSGGFVAPTLPLASNEITFTNGTLASGASATITITGTAPDTGEFPRTIENTAVVDPDDLIEEANENNNTVTIATQVNSDLPDLTITKADTPDPVLVGGTLTYTLTVTNVAGGVPATNIEVKDTLPSGFNFLSTGVSGGGFTASQSGDIVTFSGGSLADGESATLTITGSAPQEAGTLTNTAVVDPNNQIAERNEDNNTATAMTTVATVPPIPPMPTPPNIPGPGFPNVPGFPNFPGFPPVFVPPALTPTIEPPPGGALPPIYLSTTSPNNFRGTEAPEFIYGGPFDDTIDGAGGNDTILGREGRDLLIGGNGSDKLFGNQGDDRLYGGDGDDTVYGGKDNDFINGERGHDFLRGDLGDDTVRGGDGDDTLYGGKGNDWLLGDKGDDYLSGDLGDDVLDGIGRDRDSVGEIDTLIGGEGSNLFVLGTTHTIYYDDRSPGAGYGDYALIEDFNASQDRLQLKGGVNYLLNFSPNGLPGGTGIYVDDGSSPGVWDTEDELIAVLKDIAPNNSLFDRMNFV
ncbi:CARDB domain-containing protein [Trichothermofontia sp.]